MSLRGLRSVCDLRSLREREALLALWLARALEADRRAAVPSPANAPGAGTLTAAELSAAMLVAELGQAHRSRCLDLVAEAETASETARVKWAEAASAHRALERLLARRYREERSRRTKKAQAGLDEAALVMWGRQR